MLYLSFLAIKYASWQHWKGEAKKKMKRRREKPPECWVERREGMKGELKMVISERDVY